MPQTLYQLQTYLADSLASLDLPPEQLQAEVRLILTILAEIPLESLYLQPDQDISDQILEKINTLLNKRVQKRMPLQYLLGQAGFYGRTFKVAPGVLIPRPETELLVEKAITLIQTHSLQQVLDIGTGSGAIAISIACQTSAHVVAVDLSPEALAIAQENARLHQCPVEFYLGDLFAPVTGQRFDLIVSNPPYIDPKLKPTLTPEVSEHEPAMALFPPQEPYAFYRRIAQEATDYLLPKGFILVELGADMAQEARQIFEAQPFKVLEVIQDFAGIPRVLVAAQTD